MTDQVNTPEAGAQPQETAVEADKTITLEQMQQDEQNQGQEAQETTQEAEPKAQKVVPLAALHEERQRVKELREKQRQMEERFNQFQQVVTQRLQPQEQAPQIPAVDVDPVGHFKAENEQLKRQLEQIGRPVQEIQQRIAQQEQEQRVKMFIGGQIEEFAKEKPDVREAITHAQTVELKAMQALGYDHATASQIVTRQFDQMIVGLLQQGRNVAESMYALAQAKGYQPKTAASAEQKLQNTQKVAGAARSLGSSGGVVNKLSLAALAEMPADEFAKAVGDEASWRKLMGG